MGSGTYSEVSYRSYATSRGYTLDDRGTLKTNKSAQEMFVQRYLHPDMDLRGKIRECCDTEEHPNTVPVILALDVTGSMGDGATKVAKELNVIMTDIMKEVDDVEFMIMGIGDLAYDNAPIQGSQFESDIRIAEHLDKIYFEGGGGGNMYESYTAAWYVGLNHTKLDCWNRGRKGIIITMGDEPINPILPKNELNDTLDDHEQQAVETRALYAAAADKFDIFHLAIKDPSTAYDAYQSRDLLKPTWCKVLPDDHYIVATLNQLPLTISKIVKDCAQNTSSTFTAIDATSEFNSGEVSW